jgi:hypothetical protein
MNKITLPLDVTTDDNNNNNTVEEQQMKAESMSIPGVSRSFLEES